MKILVLGHTGMLGRIVLSYLHNQYDTYTTSHRYPSDEFTKYIQNFDGDWVINCIGAIPQKYSTFEVNYELPILLDTINKFKIIHSSTDDTSGNTPYSISKNKADDWIYKHSKNTYSIKSSIIGEGGNGLLNWVLSNTTVSGYSRCMWNGITTLEWAKFCKKLIDGEILNTHISLKTDCISKYELLHIISTVYNHTVNIVEDNVYISNNCIDGIYVGSIEDKLIELKKFNENLLHSNRIL